MSNEIMVPAPGVAVIEPNGVGSYRTESVSLGVRQGDGVVVLELCMGDRRGEMRLGSAEWSHLACCLISAAPPCAVEALLDSLVSGRAA